MLSVVHADFQLKQLSVEELGARVLSCVTDLPNEWMRTEVVEEELGQNWRLWLLPEAPDAPDGGGGGGVLTFITTDGVLQCFISYSVVSIFLVIVLLQHALEQNFLHVRTGRSLKWHEEGAACMFMMR
ncbi:hypothetical protein Tco_0983035 [Tanacetum coccineum]